MTDKISKTDWKRVNAMTDDDIDYSDIPELDEEFWENAKVVIPKNYGIIEKTPNTAENRASLRAEGMFAYNVFYWDTDAGVEKCVGARWNSNGKNFEYCDGRFAFSSDKPRLEPVPDTPPYNPVTAWAKCSDMRTEKSGKPEGE